MGLNRANHHIARALDRTKDDVHQRTGQLRQGMVAKQPAPILAGEGEGDEVYIVAGHQGTPAVVANKGAVDDVEGSRASEDAARLTPRSPRSSG